VCFHPREQEPTRLFDIAACASSAASDHKMTKLPVRELVLRIPVTPTLYVEGTLAVPSSSSSSSSEGPFPLVLLLPGSGPCDRNENVRGFPLNCSGLLSDFAVERGFATFRYDKRGVGHSQGTFHTTGFHDFVSDALKVWEYLLASDAVDKRRAVLVGHSEGCWTICAMYARLKNLNWPLPRAVILLAGYGFQVRELMQRQKEAYYDALEATRGCVGWLVRKSGVVRAMRHENKATMDAVMRAPENQEYVCSYLVFRTYVKWVREIVSYEARFDQFDCAVLAVTGSRDLQVRCARALCFFVCLFVCLLTLPGPRLRQQTGSLPGQSSDVLPSRG